MTVEGSSAPRLVPLSPGWTVWPLAALRSAGMPADRVLALARPDRGQGLTATEQLAVDPWFVEAVCWQNRDMANNWLMRYSERLASGDRSLHRRSYREGLIARYAQRYGMKNDTIGFFGPVAWATIEPTAGHVRAGATGDEVGRRSYFETWAVAELAERWSMDHRLRAHLPPWRDPSARLAGTRFIRPRRSAVHLSEEEVAVLRLCDGHNSPADILVRLIAEAPALGFAHVTEVRSILGSLCRRGCVEWGLRLPVDDRAEQHLLDALRDVPDVEVSGPYIARLRHLIELREDVDKAAGDPRAVLDALNAVNREYAALTTADVDRPRHSRSAGRSILWMDAVTDWNVTLGRAALDDLREPLGLVLSLCRWLTWQVARGIADVVQQRLARAEDRRVPFAVLLAELAPELTGTPGGVLDAVRQEIVHRISKVLPHSGSDPLRVHPTDVAAAWANAFDAPGPGWEGARMHSPDIMLASPVGGEDFWVLNEIHVAVNTLDNRFFVRNQPEPGEIEDLVRRSTRNIRYVPAVPRTWPDITSRTYPPLTVDVPDRFRYWSIEADDVLPRERQRMPVAGLSVVRRAGEPWVVDDREPVAPFTDLIGELLSFLVGNAFTMFPQLPHVPRVQLGKLVVQRETWHLAVEAVLTGANRIGGETRLAETLRTAGVTRHCYVRMPGDPKPFFCDLESGLLLRNLLRLLHDAVGTESTVRFQEMLPGADQLWLTDGAGKQRTSEFRLVAVDERTGKGAR